jgi:hypothetical protein
MDYALLGTGYRLRWLRIVLFSLDTTRIFLGCLIIWFMMMIETPDGDEERRKRYSISAAILSGIIVVLSICGAYLTSYDDYWKS